MQSIRMSRRPDACYFFSWGYEGLIRAVRPTEHSAPNAQGTGQRPVAMSTNPLKTLENEHAIGPQPGEPIFELRKLETVTRGQPRNRDRLR